MNMREKVLLCVIPYGLAGYLWFSLTSPIFTEGATQDNALNQKRREQDDLKTKLDDLSKLEKQHKSLEDNIQTLRASVPKTADLDLMVIDLEKMALESGLDVVAVSPPGKDELKEEAEESEEEGEGPPVSRMPGPPGIPGGPGSMPGAPPQLQGGQAAAPAASLKSKDTQVAETGLKSELVQVKLTGDYPAFVTFMRKFDAYQRVVDMNKIEVKIPTKTAGGDSGEGGEGKGQDKEPDPKHLDITVRVTAYYLP